MLRILGRQTFYSFRRAAIIEVRHDPEGSTEMAQETAGHMPGASNTAIFRYDNVGLEDVDFTAFRLGQEATATRKELRDMFNQAKIAIANTTIPDAQTLREKLDARVKDALQLDDKYIEMETRFRALLEQGATLLGDLGYMASGSAELLSRDLDLLKPSNELPEGQQAAQVEQAKYIATRLRSIFLERKLLRRSLVTRYRREINDQIADEHKQFFMENTAHAKRVVSQAPSNVQPSVPDRIQSAIDESVALMEAIAAQQRSQIEALDNEIDDEDDGLADAADEDLLEEALDSGHMAPRQWSNLPDEVTVECDRGDDFATDDERLKYMMARLLLKNIPTSGIRCVLCQLDPTVDLESKDRGYVAFRLERHLKGNFHSKAAQVKRAVVQEIAAFGRVTCRICANPWSSISEKLFMKHMNEKHKDRLVENLVTQENRREEQPSDKDSGGEEQ
jgi:hypothetical protein